MRDPMRLHCHPVALHDLSTPSTVERSAPKHLRGFDERSFDPTH
jgi:hypothetical protein